MPHFHYKAKTADQSTLEGEPLSARRLETKLAIPSLAKYAFVSNSAIRYGAGTEIFGPIHSNDGIRFDGLAHNIVTSAKDLYDDPDHTGAQEFGVHTHVNQPPATGIADSGLGNEHPPAAVPVRPDVFMSGRQFPVPAVDFTGLTQNLSNLKTSAQEDGHYLAPSGASGYNIVLRTDGTYRVYRVDSLQALPSNCTNVNNQTSWGSWSINNQTLLGTYPYPDNGVIFAEDHVWVEGQLGGDRLTIAAGRFPASSATYAHLTVNKSVLYSDYNGGDVLALIAQGNVNVGWASADTIEIDAALVAQNGRVGRHYYSTNCSPNHVRSQITVFGMIATNLRYGFAYTNGTGYITRNITYDGNLLYGPPPSFPLTSDQYTTISWREL